MSDQTRQRIFISYKRNVEPDHVVAQQVYNLLRQRHDVFIDTTMGVGVRWAETIDQEIRRSDVFIAMLSENSVNSEMVLGEIETAFNTAKSNNGRPAILPVRLNYQAPFRYPLNAYLNAINWAFWSGPADTPRLVRELLAAISHGTLPVADEPIPAHAPTPATTTATTTLVEPLPAAQPRLERPEGTMDSQSRYYVERPGDSEALDAITAGGATVTIRGSRQIGKSSLLMRLINAGQEAHMHVAFVDFQRIENAVRTDADTFYRQFAGLIARRLHLTIDDWDNRSGNNEACTDRIESLLNRLDAPLIVALDEVDSLLGVPYQSDFFGMLRSWHNERALNPLWRRLNLVMVISTDPYLLIDNPRQSPFNVGTPIELEDFTEANVTDLNHRHGDPLTARQVSQLMALLGGHPFLTRKALYLVAKRLLPFDSLMEQAARPDGPYRDHLNYHLYRLLGHTDLIHGLHEIINHHVCTDRTVLWRLEGAGLVRKAGRSIVPRCELYARFLEENLGD